MARGNEWATMLALVAVVLATSSNADMCGVDPNDPESMKCDGGTGTYGTLYAAASPVPVADGLSYDYYQSSCPTYKSIIYDAVSQACDADNGNAAGLLRMFFHDCFITGCDASVLLTTSSSGEQSGIPNLTLRQSSLQLVDTIKAKLEQVCPGTVSCADILAVTSAVAIEMASGPQINVPVGRRDSKTFQTGNFVNGNLPSPRNTVAQNLVNFTNLGLSLTDMVGLVGGHTLGRAHCGSFFPRLSPTLDTELDPKLGQQLVALCPTNTTDNTHVLDGTAYKFDNNFFKGILTGDAVLKSDADMDDDEQVRTLVRKYAKDGSQFVSQFIISYLKMGQLNVLTGNSGEIRKVCTATNGGNTNTNTNTNTETPTTNTYRRRL